MAKLPSLDHVKFVRSKGKVYAYFNTGQKRNGRAIYVSMPDPSSVGFYDSYASLKAARTKRAITSYTVANIARDFEYSAVFKDHSEGTQLAYSKTLRRITATLGKFPVNALERSHIQGVLDREMVGAGSHNLFVAVVAAMYKWGGERDLSAIEPTKGIARRKSDPYKPWPEDLLDAALAAEDATVRLLTHLLYFTGQRLGDVLKMRWTDYRAGEVHVVQQKTGKELWIRASAELRTELARTTKAGMTLVVGVNNKPMSGQFARNLLQSFAEDRGHKIVPHGLRKNAVIALLEAEGSVAEVAAITGQTYAIVEHYAQQINKRNMASAGVIKLENKRRSGKRNGKPA